MDVPPTRQKRSSLVAAKSDADRLSLRGTIYQWLLSSMGVKRGSQTRWVSHAVGVVWGGMAELSLYLTESDELPVVALAFRLGCVIVPDLHYPTPRYDSLKTLDSYKRYRLRERLFYLVSEKFFRCPLEMNKVEKGTKIGYYIGNDGGPRIQFLGGGIFEEAGSKFIRPGSIGHQAKYWNQLNGEMERPPTELVDTYKSLQKLIRNSFRHSKPGKVSFWMGPEAVEAVKSGAKLVGYEKYPSQKLLE